MTMEVKAKILKISLQLFSSKGYYDTTTKEIANLSGINETTLFYHFKDKETIYREVVETFSQLSADNLISLDGLEGQDTYADLCLLAKCYAHFILEHIDIVRLTINQTPRMVEINESSWIGPPIIKQHFQAYLQKIDEGRDYSVESALFVSQITRLVLFSVLTRKEQDIEELIEQKLLEMCRLYVESLL